MTLIKSTFPSLLALLVATLVASTTALAQQPAAAPGQGPSTLELLMPFAVMFFVMYFLMIRPQQKKAREHSDLLKNLKPGDEVVTTGGIIGRVRSVAESFVTLEVSSNVNLKVLKGNVSGFTKPVEKDAAAGKKA